MNDNFSEWWSSMTTMEHVYWVIAVPASIMFVFFMIMTFIGGDVEGDTDFDTDADADFDADGEIPFQFITIKNLVGFFTIFSWTGLACIKSACGTFTVLLSSTIAGILMMLAMAGVYYLMSKLTESGNVDLNKAVGAIGEVYLIIKGNRKAMGKVQLKIEGTFKTLDAITDDDEDIKTGELVDVIDVTNNNILIVKTNSNKS